MTIDPDGIPAIRANAEMIKSYAIAHEHNRMDEYTLQNIDRLAKRIIEIVTSLTPKPAFEDADQLALALADAM